jgi:hypothetical protein
MAGEEAEYGHHAAQAKHSPAQLSQKGAYGRKSCPIRVTTAS